MASFVLHLDLAQAQLLFGWETLPNYDITKHFSVTLGGRASSNSNNRRETKPEPENTFHGQTTGGKILSQFVAQRLWKRAAASYGYHDAWRQLSAEVVIQQPLECGVLLHNQHELGG